MDEMAPRSICGHCGKECRTMNTSDDGWKSVCLNCDCPMKGEPQMIMWPITSVRIIFEERKQNER